MLMLISSAFSRESDEHAIEESTNANWWMAGELNGYPSVSELVVAEHE